MGVSVVRLENCIVNQTLKIPPDPPFPKGGRLTKNTSPFEKGGLRGISRTMPPYYSCCNFLTRQLWRGVAFLLNLHSSVLSPN